ncbi:Segregation and condensation protein A [Planctomycetales bacterium 10988]|nr:Segregation and condensation protein A [Planctomycetales bacterium 10988]
MEYQVELDNYQGPLDLLLYLVRRHEVDIFEIPISTITQQYLDFLELMQELQLEEVGDFLVLASSLIEIKARQALPQAEEGPELEEPQEDLIQQLIEYKQLRDASQELEERGRIWQQRFARRGNDLPPREKNPAHEPIREVELWDLVSAYGRIMRDREVTPGTNITYDETPLEKHMERIQKRLQQDEQVALTDLFQPGMHKSGLMGLFQGMLELVRHHGYRTHQDELFEEVWLLPCLGEQEQDAPPTLPMSEEAVDSKGLNDKNKSNDAESEQAASGE